MFPGGGQSKQRGLAGAFKVAARRIFLVVVRKNARHDVCGFSSASFPVNHTTDVGLCFAAMVRPATVMSNERCLPRPTSNIALAKQCVFFSILWLGFFSILWLGFTEITYWTICIMRLRWIDSHNLHASRKNNNGDSHNLNAFCVDSHNVGPYCVDPPSQCFLGLIAVI